MNKSFIERSVILHAHIFKNAGTTIDWILERNFGCNFRDDREDQRMLTDPDYLPKLLKKYPDLKAVSSHSVPLPLTLPGSELVHILVMLRHPILRVRSVYEFERHQVAKTPGAIHAKKYDFKDYVSWRMKKEVAPTIRNMQVSYLTRTLRKQRDVLNNTHLEQAIDFVSQNPFAGVVEKFDLSMNVFGHQFQLNGLDIHLSYKKQNVTDKLNRTNTEKLQILEDDLGASLYHQLLASNQLDIELYTRASEILQKRYDSIQNKSETV